MLDEKDPISNSYNLEVSSCGLERHLREINHFEAAKCKQIEIKLYTHYEGRKSYTGKVVNVTNEVVTILDDSDVEINLDFSNISSAKILFNWEE